MSVAVKYNNKLHSGLAEVANSTSIHVMKNIILSMRGGQMRNDAAVFSVEPLTSQRVCKCEPHEALVGTFQNKF